MPPQKATSLVAGLASAARHHATGSVVSRAKGTERRIWVWDGKIVFAESKDPNESFATILAFRGVLLESERMAIASVSQPGTRDDLAVAASGILGPVEVLNHAKTVLEERLAIDFALPGSIWIAEPSPPPDDLPNVGLPIAIALVNGIRTFPPERLRLEFPIADDDRYVFRAAGLSGFPELNLSKEESRLTGRLDGVRTWKQVVVESKLPPDIAHRAVFAMAVLRIAEYLTPATSVLAEAAATTYDETPSAPGQKGRAAATSALGAGRADEMRERASKPIPEMLEIPVEAAPEVVEEGVRGLIARYDLGRAHFLPEADRDAALLLLDRAMEAWLVLTHPETRTKYFAAPQWDRDVTASSLGSALAAERGYAKAGVFLQAGNYLAAEAALLPSIQANPKESRYHLRMGIAIYLRARARGDSGAPVGAVRALQKAIALDPKADEGYLYLGHVALAAGDKYAAKTYYETALRLNPSNNEARRALMRVENA